MEFGHLPEEMLDKADLSLPADPPINDAVLPGLRATDPKLYLGATRWTQPEWLGNLYPEKAKAADFLQHYAAQFNCIELNATHYKLYDAVAMLKWQQQAEAGSSPAGRSPFLFCPKLYQGITHRGSLKGKESMVSEFTTAMDALRDRGDGNLGPIFIQLSEAFGPGRQVELLEFLSSLPTGFNWMVELRHPEWFSKPTRTEQFFQTLRTINIGAVITDVAGRRDVCHMHLPLPSTMIRFVGNQGHATDRTRLEAWATRLAKWYDAGLQQAVFLLHLGNDSVLPAFSQFAAKTLSTATGIALALPKLHESSQGKLF